MREEMRAPRNPLRRATVVPRGNTLATHAPRTAHILPWPDRTSTDHYPAPRVLIIEEHADTRELYELWLSQRGFAVCATASGQDGLAAARAHAPDLVIVELMVPDGGVALIRAVRGEAACRDTIIVVLTTQADSALREHALEAGADFYLVKPCGVVRLGEVMVIASRDRSRLIAPEISGAKRPKSRLRLAIQRSRAIRERLASDAAVSPVPPGVH
jgi:DNA-binding response OmpR family regulator